MQVRASTPTVILASSRSDGNTFALARMAFLEESVPLIDIGTLDISYYSYSHGNSEDDFLPLIERLLISPVWVLATPLYWYSMSAQAKTFLDRLSDLLSFRKGLGRQLRGKTLAVLCTGTDAELPSSFEQPFELTAKYLGMAYAGSFYAQFEERTLARPDSMASARAFGRGLLDQASNPFIEATSSSKLRLLPAVPHVER